MSISGARPIALALSGGGIRSMIFHLGVLRFLAEQQALEEVKHISSVSGGSLVTGLIFQETGMRWPTSPEYLATVYEALRVKLCRRSMQWDALRQLMWPPNLRFLLSRSNLLAAALRSEWGITSKLSQLPSSPEWSINGTNAHNGRRFRFKKVDMGDYKSGYAAPGDFPLANAMAVSAAFPGGFGPLSLRTGRYVWKLRDWGAPKGSERTVVPPPTLHLYDGGVYDNLGIEPFFDGGRSEEKMPNLFILVSDAGFPLPDGFSSFPLSPFRLKRVADIMSDQSHALRIRAFHHYLKQGPERGAFVYIAEESSVGGKTEREFAASYPTTLKKVDERTFDRISEHGYQMAKQRLAGQSA